MAPEHSEGAEAAVDSMTVEIQTWIGQLRRLRKEADNTARIAHGTDSAAKARAIVHALNEPMGFPRLLTFLRTRDQQVMDDTSSRASEAMLTEIAGGEPLGLLDTFGE